VEVTDRVADGVAGIGTPVASLADLNSLFDAWLHQVYHQRVHSETDQAPLQRFLAHGAPVPNAASLGLHGCSFVLWLV
jgi:putative transposase